jgi:hypothetical protein
MAVPIGDWQFYVVTAAALCGAVAIVRPLFTRRKANADGSPAACPHCASGTAACSKASPAPAAGGERLVTLGSGRRAG